MLEDFVVPAAAQRLRSCVLGGHLDRFCAGLADLGYQRRMIRHKLRVVRDWARWLTEEHLGIGDLDDGRVDEFVAARRRGGRTRDGVRTTLLMLLEQLRSAGVVPTPAVYLHADLRLKEKALARTTSTRRAPGRYRPGDALLAFLEGL